MLWPQIINYLPYQTTIGNSGVKRMAEEGRPVKRQKTKSWEGGGSRVKVSGTIPPYIEVYDTKAYSLGPTDRSHEAPNG